MHLTRYYRAAGLGAMSLLGTCLVLTGCGSGIFPAVYSNASAITGNWQLSSTDPRAALLPALSGQLTGSNAAVTGTVHSNSISACIAPTTVVELNGLAGADNLITLSGKLAGGTLTITGTLSADGKTLSGASYNVTGGTCAFSAAVQAIAQSYSPLVGDYSGIFTDFNGHTLNFNVQLSQSLTPDANGNFPLSGSSTLTDNTCYTGLISITNALVTGESFSFDYTDPNQGNNTAVAGTSSVDASTLTVTDWQLTGPCNTTHGTGVLTRQ